MHAKHSHWLFEIFIFKTLCHHFQPELITPLQRGYVLAGFLDFFHIPLWPPVANFLANSSCTWLPVFYITKLKGKEKIMRERERETMQLSFGPTFWGMLTKCYLLWTSQVCKCEFIFLGNSQNISYFNWWSIELANKEERRRTLIALWWWAAPCSCDCFCMAAWLPGVRARSVVVRERERHTHTHTCHLLWPLADAKKAHHSIAELSFVEVCVIGRVCFLGVLSCI